MPTVTTSAQYVVRPPCTPEFWRTTVRAKLPKHLPQPGTHGWHRLACCSTTRWPGYRRLPQRRRDCRHESLNQRLLKLESRQTSGADCS